MSRSTLNLTLALSLCVLTFQAQTAEAQIVDVLAFGDSITHGLGDTNVECFQAPSGGYPQRLSQNLANQGLAISIRTFGVCGEHTAQGLSRLDQVLANNPGEVIVIMEGTNDLSSLNISTESIKQNILLMVDKALEAGVRPVMAAPIPRAPEAGSNGRTAFLANLLQAEADAQDIDFADQYRNLINVSNLYENFYSDPFHPNPSGYDLVADGFVEATMSAVQRPVEPEPCIPGPQTLCLNQHRFKVEVDWRDFEGNTGVGQALPRTSDTGMFWFFDEDNIELVIKVLDGRVLNDHFWVFYGALSTVEYTITVTDSETGERRMYFNQSGTQASVGDTSAFFFPPVPEAGVANTVEFEEAASASRQSLQSEPFPGVPRSAVQRFPKQGSLSLAQPSRSFDKEGATCEADDLTLCLRDGRFRVRVAWTDFENKQGNGHQIPLTDETGYFWFFNEANIELVVKILDGVSLSDHFWVFYGALSNVAYEIEVTDMMTGEVVIYNNPSGEFGSVADTTAFFVP